MPVDRSKLNAVGDIVVTDPHALRALADPLNLRLFDLVRRLGPATTGQLASEVGEDDEHVEARLAALESTGFIEPDGRDPSRWSTPARGIHFEIPEDGEQAQQAARNLSNVMLAGASELPKRWTDQVEPELSVEWARAAGLFNARVVLSADELRRLQEQLERLLEPYNTRAAGEQPSDAAMVRVLAFFMPEHSDAAT
jgi:hypothetical protein